MLAFEAESWRRGLGRIAGVDEAGRGPLVGPVVAAAVVFVRGFAQVAQRGMLHGLTDSKQVSEKRREEFFEVLQAAPEVEIGVGQASSDEIDKINILRATHLAMRRAVEGLPSLPDYILVDGRPVDGLPVKSTAIVKGDAKSLSIAAASIIAKVTRDRMMYELAQRHPEYGFASHKGYGTRAHLEALKEYGPLPEHRQTFAPIKNLGMRVYRQLDLI
jgi:ribonuclease HII